MNGLEKWFSDFVNAVISQQREHIVSCYQLPCVMSTPEQTLIVLSTKDLSVQLSTMINQINSLNVKSADVGLNLVEAVDKSLWLVNALWKLKDSNGAIVTEFATVYQLLQVDDGFKIVNVISYETSS